MANILITGGSGMVGQHLTSALKNKQHLVSWLSTSGKRDDTVFYWDVKKRIMDEKALANTQVIIHLAGANVGKKRWTESYKHEIVNSRVEGANLIFEYLRKTPNKVKTVVSASAIGFYGERGDEWCTESDAPGQDFLAETCFKWETAIRQISSLGIRTVSIRTGIVLSADGGALQPLKNSVMAGIAPIFGNGKQFYSWIHLDDLCGIYAHAAENESLTGSYNAVAPKPERYIDMMKQLAAVCHRPFIPVRVPMSLLKILKGEFVETLAASTRCSAEKILQTGFQFRWKELNPALEYLLK